MMVLAHRNNHRSSVNGSVGDARRFEPSCEVFGTAFGDSDQIFGENGGRARERRPWTVGKRRRRRCEGRSGRFSPNPLILEQAKLPNPCSIADSRRAGPNGLWVEDASMAASETGGGSSVVAKRLGQRSATPIRYLERREVGLVNGGLGPSESGYGDGARGEGSAARAHSSSLSLIC
ncbi:hypothetical protein V6N11_010432 [Hibiscus sabdariffa]|uniref:Uncharacterized protein n=1 Tax=Hibiscus sabdariffa TaxID=183260 RepID=A0ABR2S5S9_9ROSI